jgi:hypothetical protein
VYFHCGSGATYRKVSEIPTGFQSIPTIDISNIDGSLDERRAIAEQVRQACMNVGFFYVKNHGIAEHVLDEAFGLLKRFFDLPKETKMTAHVQKNPAIRGYGQSVAMCVARVSLILGSKLLRLVAHRSVKSLTW